MIKRNIQFFIVLVLLIGIGGFFIFGIAVKQDPDRDYRGAFKRNYMIFTPEIPKSADFAGEKVPLDIYYVRESFDREITAFTFMHSTTQHMFKRAHRYFPVIEPILKKHHIPNDFKYMAIAESNLRNVTSPAGAEGIWQFMQSTARNHGLEVNAKIDERYNLKKATEAACKYLLEAYDSFGNWTLAAAAYNRGMNGMRRAVKNQMVSNYYDLFLNEESARYIFRILAAKEIYENPTKYGFYLRESDFYPPIETYIIVVDTTIEDLPGFAHDRGLTYKIIREFNPWIHNYSLPNKSRRTYELTLPKKGALTVKQKKDRLKEMEAIFHDTLLVNEIH